MKKEHVLNLHKIRSLGYLEEAISWNSDGNFDRISAGGMLFIYREEILRRITSSKANQEAVNNKLANDKFFAKNYKQQNSYTKMSEIPTFKYDLDI